MNDFSSLCKMKLRLFLVIKNKNDRIPRILSYEKLIIFNTWFASPRKMNRVAIKGGVYTLFKNGFAVLQIFQFLVVAFGHANVKLRSIYRWIREIKSGIFSFEHKKGAGRPRAGRCEKFIRIIEQKIQEDDSITLKALRLETGLSFGTIFWDCLQYCKI